jgi:hypothetical protein
MRFKYKLPDYWVNKVRTMEEFANGATQVTVRLKDGTKFHEVLISDATFLIAVRGFEDLPFELSEIDDITQDGLDKNPVTRGGWRYWDDWGS